ncbi:hypothetical protein HNQ91_002928 [Filimonas zeae]|uniref:Uncharacterized protein n=1 Tax=Filimonas zeae TaxID=1737353 RepID=A0A917IZD7_9BACT|nr:hypothetical protein [Filimonas zeae]MDR6339863.1 hypothetical protein [Filimonas zeae]GGH70022.1 hypothetical protein GCM10011379_27890 [Filimonas zeae]
MFNLFSSMFKRKKDSIKLLGRAGMSFYDGNNEYYLDTDNIRNEVEELDIVIYYSGTGLRNESRPLSIEEKISIAARVREIMESGGARVGFRD